MYAMSVALLCLSYIFLLIIIIHFTVPFYANDQLVYVSFECVNFSYMVILFL